MQTLDIEPGEGMVSGWGMGLGLPMAVDDGIRHWQRWGGGGEGRGNYLHPLEDASESSKWAASRGHSYKCQKRAKQIDDKRKRKPSYVHRGRRGKRKRQRDGAGPPLNIQLIKASSDSACKWLRPGRKWKQTAITKGKKRRRVIKYQKKKKKRRLQQQRQEEEE